MAKKTKASFADILFSSAFIHNPVLMQMVGLGAIVAVATTLKTALVLAVVFFPVMIVTQVIANLLLKKVPRWIRVVLYLVIGTAIVAPVMYLIDRFDPSLRIGAGIYLGLTAVSSITALHCEKLAVKTDFKHAFFDAVACAVGYGTVIIFVGFLRELLGMASVWGKPISLPFTFPSVLMPFGGFIVLAFCAAALKALINKRFPEYAEETELEIKKTSVIVSKKNLPAEEEPIIKQQEETVQKEEELAAENERESDSEKESETESEQETDLAADTSKEETEDSVDETKEEVAVTEDETEPEPEPEKSEDSDKDSDLEYLTPMIFDENNENTSDYDIDEIIKAFEKREFPDIQTNSDDYEFGTALSHLFDSVEFDYTSATKDEISEDGEDEK